MNINNSISKVIIDEETYKFMEEECIKNVNLKIETGGSIFGTIKEGILYITMASGAGNAKKSYAHIRTDSSYQSKMLRKAKNLGYSYLGDYHLHPFGFHNLSDTDLNTITNILKNENNILEDGLFCALLFVYDNQELIIYPFTATLNNKSEMIISKHLFEIINLENLKKTKDILVSEQLNLNNYKIQKPKKWKLYANNLIKNKKILKSLKGFVYPEEKRICISEKGNELKKQIKLKFKSKDNSIFYEKEKIEISYYNTDEFYNRISKLEIIDSVKGKRIAIVGCGSIGSRISLNLLSSGANELYLIDKDTLELENFIRWLAPIDWEKNIGRDKVKVLKEYLNTHFKNTSINTFNNDIVAEQGKINEEFKINNIDLIICSTDNDLSRRIISRISNNLKIPALYVTLSDGADSGQIILTENSLTSCYECFSNQLGQNDFSKQNSALYGRNTSVQGLAIDINTISSIASKIALNILKNGVDDTLNEYFRSNINDLGIMPNLIWFSNQKGWIFEYPFQKVSCIIPKDDNCYCN